MAITYKPETNVDFSLTLALGSEQKQVTIYAADLANVATQGLHFALPPGSVVTLGNLSDLIGWLNTQLAAAGVTTTIPAVASTDWPTVIQDVFNGILHTEVTVTRLVVDQDKKDTEQNYPPLRFSLDVTGLAMNSATPPVPTPIPIINGLFAVAGGGIGLRRSYDGAPLEVELAPVPAGT